MFLLKSFSRFCLFMLFQHSNPFFPSGAETLKEYNTPLHLTSINKASESIQQNHLFYSTHSFFFAKPATNVVDVAHSHRRQTEMSSVNLHIPRFFSFSNFRAFVP